MFEASCPRCRAAASPYDATCPACGASLRVPCRDCTALVHVADGACYGCAAAWPADPTPRAALTPAPAAPAAAGSDQPGPLGPPPADTALAAEPTGRTGRRLAPLASLAAAVLVIVSGVVFVATSGEQVPTGGVSTAGAQPTTPPPAAPSAADVERDRLAAELGFGLGLTEPVARCVADAVRAELGDAVFVAAHLDLTGDAPDAGHAVLDPAIAAAQPSCAAATSIVGAAVPTTPAS